MSHLKLKFSSLLNKPRTRGMLVPISPGIYSLLLFIPFLDPDFQLLSFFFSLKENFRIFLFSTDFSGNELSHLSFVQKCLCFTLIFKVISMGLKF